MQKNIDEYGPESNAFISMTGNYGVYSQVMSGLLAATYDGTQLTNFGIMGDNACNMGFLPILGVQQDASCWEDMMGSKTAILFGCNYAETNMQEMHFLFDAQEAGMTLVVVDRAFLAHGRQGGLVDPHSPRHRRRPRLGHDESYRVDRSRR